jgi:hypothetical protein
MNLFTQMSVDSMCRFSLGAALVVGFVAATCCCGVILKRQLVANWRNEAYPFLSAQSFNVPYKALSFCLAAIPVVTIYMSCVFVYEETLKQAGLL